MKIFTSIFFAAILSVLFSCKQKNARLGYLQDVDRVSVYFIKGADSLSYAISKTSEIELLAETAIDASPQYSKLQDTTGTIWFIRNDTLMLELYFTTPGTGSKFDAPVFVYGEEQGLYAGGVTKGGRFTYKVGSLLEELYSIMRSKRK